jgi:hypothetical protein
LEQKLDLLFAELRAMRAEAKAVQQLVVDFETAATILDVSMKTLRRMIARGDLLTVVISKVPKVPLSELRRMTTPKPVLRPAPASRRKKGAASTGRYAAKLEKMRKRF